MTEAQKRVMLQVLLQNRSFPDYIISKYNMKVPEINALLSPFHFKVVKFLKFYYLINTHTDDNLKALSYEYNVSDIFALKEIISALQSEQSLCLPEDDIVSYFKSNNITKTAAESRVLVMVNDGWLERLIDEDGAVFYSFGPRTLLELREILEESISSCAGCKHLRFLALALKQCINIAMKKSSDLPEVKKYNVLLVKANSNFIAMSCKVSTE
ncbi:hypothetical protein ROZALSC1DRAFT_29845 [Rozella allomycis CSF55]|uniref:Uncharacterized protein n=1 Tax=Rozella allomycis (strain CSF55) TaxID=988480 RepID=A0A4P9YG72_ROZAC|nr:hypothetical protein ROZALSC1DRAFT_29845 [Rozella allomycis CSF55]